MASLQPTVHITVNSCLSVAIIAFAGCAEAGPSPRELATRNELVTLLIEDPAIAPLADMDRMVNERRPSDAASIIADAVLPALDRFEQQISRFDARQSAAMDGERERARSLLSLRRAALVELQAVYSRGADTEDARLLHAMRTHREAETRFRQLVQSLATPTSNPH